MELATLRAKGMQRWRPCSRSDRAGCGSATEAQAIGYGGTALVAEPRVSRRSTIQRGLRELTADEPLAGGRTRRAGGGRKRAIDLDATLLRDLDALVEPTAPGDPTRRCGGRARAHGRWRWRSTVWATASATRWSPSCCTDWATACRATPRFVRAANAVDRDAQFRYIARRVRRAQRQQQPTISVDTKKKELVGAFKNAGRTWRPAKTPQRVQVHDFVIPATATTGGKAIPYGIYDLHRNEALGECRDRSRHRELRGTVDPALAAARWVARRIDKPSRC